MKLFHRIKKMICILLVTIMMIPGNIPVFVRAEKQEDHMAAESNHRFSLILEWGDSEFKDGSIYQLHEDSDTVNAVRIRVNYSNEEVSETGYRSGELVIIVKGIGGVNRDGVIEAQIGADKADSSAKNRDWSYTWDKYKDTYTFTNNNEIPPNSVVSGYFDMVWELKSRDTIHGYSQDDISAELLLPDSSSIVSNVLSFGNYTICDEYSVDIERSSLYSSNGVSGSLQNPDDYVFIKYNLSSYINKKSRGAAGRENFIFDPDVTDAGTGLVLTYSSSIFSDSGDGTYKVVLVNDTILDQYVIVAYPKDQYVGNPTTASISSYGTFHEGDDDGNTGEVFLSMDSIEFTMPSDFDFLEWGGPGGEYFHGMKRSAYEIKEIEDSSYAENVVVAGGHISGDRMKDGTKETFCLGFLKHSTSTNSVELVDDFLYITQNNGDYRQLTKDDYEFDELVILSTESIKNENGLSVTSGKYPVKVYAVQNDEVISLENSNLVWEGLWMDYDQNINLPAGTTAFAVRYENISEGVGKGYWDYDTWNIPTVKVIVDFHLSEDGWDTDKQSNLADGQVVNTMYVDYYDAEGKRLSEGYTEDFYDDGDINIDLAQKDIDIYGRYLDRERGGISFYGSEKSDYKSYTRLSAINVKHDMYTSDMEIGASFNFKEEETPGKFSLYTILPEQTSLDGYEIEEDIWNILSLEGLGMSPSRLAKYCTAEIIGDYLDSGRTYIALHFDFNGADVPQKSEIYAKFSMRISKDYFKDISSTVSVRSAVMIDDDLNEYSIGKVSDDGKWDFNDVLSNDIDDDGDVIEHLSYSYDYASFTYVDSSELQISKSVKASSVKDYVQLPEIPMAELGSEYSYGITIKNGNSISKNIVIADILESGSNSEWKGTFKNVDLSEAEAQGLQGTVWYSDKDKPGDVGGDDWSRSMDVEDVKAVAVDFGPGELQAGEEIDIYINMTAPEDENKKNKITENSFSASFTMIDSSTGNETRSDFLESNFVQVKLTAELKNLILTKVDEVDGEKLSGAKYSLINKETREVVASGVTNARGQIIFKNIPSDVSYVLHEDTSPAGYEIGEDTEVVFDEEDICRVTLENKRKKAKAVVIKSNVVDNYIKVEGAEYTLFTVDGGEVQKAVTDIHGKASFENIEWGEYYIQETKAPEGYKLDNKKYSLTVTKDDVDEIKQFKVTDDQDGSTSVKLTKYAMTTEGVQTDVPVSGAVFELVKVRGGQYKTVGIYVTDEHGEIFVEGLSYGEYKLIETRAPKGYNLTEDIEFSVTPDKQEQEFIAYDKRKSGSIYLFKKDNLNNIVEGAAFELYDETKNNVLGTYTTDATGTITMRDLDWGTYYIKEKSTLDCYVLNQDWFEAKVNGDNLILDLECVNETKKGTVVLTKTDEIGMNRLDGAVFTLYKDDGTVVQEGLITGANDEKGEIRVENLEWGKYYFKETEAPDGYSLTEETIRFAVNSANAGMEQRIQVTNPEDSKIITLTKKIKVDDINFDNGDPTFVFRLEGTDVNGNSHTYHRIVRFDENFVNANRDSEGFVSQSVTVSGLLAGVYAASEEESSRYSLDNVINLSANAALVGSDVTIDITTEDEGHVTFVNGKYEWADYSDNQSMANSIKRQAKLTALKVNWLGDEEVQAKAEIDRSLVEVTAIYDDGSTKILKDNEWFFGEAFGGTKFPNVNGDYQIPVTYTENKISRTGFFDVTITDMVREIVRLDVVIKEEYQTVLPGTEITVDMFHIVGVYNDGSKENLDSDSVIIEDGAVAPDGEGTFSITITLKPEISEETVSADVDMVAKYPEPVLVKGEIFYTTINSSATSVIFTDEKAPEGVALKDVSEAQDMSVVSWMDGTVYKVSTQVDGIAVYSNPDSSYMFEQKSNLINIDTSNLNTSKVTNMYKMFNKCTGLASLDVSGFDTSKVTDMSAMFQYCEKLTVLDVSGFDTSNAIEMRFMFSRCISLTSLDISGFDTSKVTTMRAMFQTCNSLTSLDVSGFDTSNVTNMRFMFGRCSGLTSLDVSGFDTSNVTDMHGMFQDCEKVTVLDVGGFDTSNVTDMGHMFDACISLTSLDIADWDTGNVTNLNAFLQQKNYGSEYCSITELDLSNWDVSNVTDFGYVFYGMVALKKIDVSAWNTSEGTDFRHTFAHCKNLNDFDCSNWDVSNAWTLDGFFHSTKKEIYDVSKWDTSNCLTFAQLFEGCSKAKEIVGLETLDTSSGKQFGEMFRMCSNLRKLDLSNFDMNSLDDSWVDPDVGYAENSTSNMLYGTWRLSEIRLGEKLVFRANMNLPAPSKSYIAGADGYWYSISTGIAYAPADIPGNVADTYAAVPVVEIYMKNYLW